jgi:hypothetical protein
MNRRQFLSCAAITLAIGWVPGAAHHDEIPYWACHPHNKDSSRDHDIPPGAIVGDCYVMSQPTRGTYASFIRPGVPE